MYYAFKERQKFINDNSILGDTIISVSVPVIGSGLSAISRDEYKDGITVFGPLKASIRQNVKVAIDGCAIVGGHVIHDDEQLSKVLANKKFDSSNTLLDWWGTNSKNPNAIYYFDSEEGIAAIAPDPLGAAAIYQYQNAGINLYSTCLDSLEIIVNSLSLPLTKSVKFQVQRIILGNGGYDSSPYEEITTIEAFHYLQISDAGSLVERYSIFDHLDHPYSYLSELDATKKDISDSIAAIANSNYSTKISHITGGFDSRLLLSAIIDSDASDVFQFFCSGPTGTADRLVADSITVDYRLRRTNKAGLSAGPTNNVTEQLVAPLFHSNGVANTGPNGREEKSGILAVGGGYGGLLRSTFGARMQSLDSSSTPQEIFSKFDPYYDHKNSMLSGHSFSGIKSSLKVEWSKISEQYRAPAQYGDALYLHVRNRYHFGYNAMQWSRIGSRVDPLYSVHGYFLSIRSTPMLRASNLIGHDLLAAFHPSLLTVPFDKPKFDHSLIGDSRPESPTSLLKVWTPEKYDNSEEVLFNDSDILPSQIREFLVAAPKPSAETRKKIIAEANKLGLNYWQIENLDAAQKILQKVIKSTAEHTLGSEIDGAYLSHLATGNLRNRKDIRNLYTIMSTSLWLAVL
ncbi:hypothetical protein ACT3UA_13240 [Glutamicibacter sp. 363]|uniref:hypothetical protein n=1 Tax=Glutamicibacter sp. 363 TaxID=3457731 RepID=UPI004034A3D5